MKTVDKRVLARRKSKNQIYDALFEFLKEKPFGEITVTSLIEKSGVARTTFYRHFSSVTEVFEGYFHCLDERFTEIDEDVAVDFKSREYLIRVFEIYRSLGERVLTIHNAGLSGRFIDAAVDFHISQLGNMSMNSPERYSLYYYAGAIYCVALQWAEEGWKETPEELADIFLEL